MKNSLSVAAAVATTLALGTASAADLRIYPSFSEVREPVTAETTTLLLNLPLDTWQNILSGRSVTTPSGTTLLPTVSALQPYDIVWISINNKTPAGSDFGVVGNGITSGQFMVVPNRWGPEGDITFYGSSFVSDPFGRIVVEAPRDADAVLVADLDIAQREEWLRLFPFFLTRRPDLYAPLVAPVDPVRDGYGAREAIAASLADAPGPAAPSGVLPAARA